MINPEIVEQTLVHLRKVAKFQPNYFKNLVPMHRLDTSKKVWYVTFYNKEKKGYELHWFDGTGNDFSDTSIITKIKEMYFIQDAEDAMCYTIGHILIGNVMNELIPDVGFTHFTPILQSLERVKEVSLVEFD